LFAPIRHRGPDDEGLCLIARGAADVRALHTERSVPRYRERLPSFRDPDAWTSHDLALLHTRYAVMDLSADAHQPFVSAEGDLVVAFQGEVFNYIELRDELEALGFRFRTASDTEVLANAYRAWEDDAWPRLNGFWSAAVFHGPSRRFVLCRDRLGVAPLHLIETPDALFFGSSALGLATLTREGARWNTPRVRDFIETGLRDFDEQTLFERVVSLRPGTFLSFEVGAASLDEAVEVRWWEVPSARLSPADLSLSEAATQLRDALASAVQYRLRAGRSVAFQLSGGLDSTSVVALAAALRPDRLPTYTVSIPEQDEEPLARTMESRFSLDRTVLRGLERGLAEELPRFARLMEEPVQAPSAYAHHVMCRRMKADGFGVTLSGSGGDEALAGYEWDFWPPARTLLWNEGMRLDALVHQMVIRYGDRRRAARSVGEWVRWAGRLPARLLRLAAANGDGRSTRLTRLATPPADASTAEALLRRYATLDYDARRRFHLRNAHLPYYLASNDRATLGIPLEHRQPFLDHRVVELGLRMPPGYLFRHGWSKYVLRTAME
jgi:asparagine synthase (glutamine-hydrolysing)